MSIINMANRQVADVDIRFLDSMMPFIFFDTANTTTVSLSSENTYAMAKGSRKIAFSNPIEGTMTIEAQVYPFEFFSLLSNGVVKTGAVYADKQEVKATTTGTLTITEPDEGTIMSGTVYVFEKDDYGKRYIVGSYSDGTFTATTSGWIKAGTTYVVCYLVSNNADEVHKISFNNKQINCDYYITQKTLDKTEDGALDAFIITAYKANIQKNFELSFSSEGDPASVTITFDLLEDKDGNVLDMVRIEDGATSGSVVYAEELGYGIRGVNE